jgi:PBSX family phage terminase large subunit
MAEIRLSSLFAPIFRPLWKAVKAHDFTHYWLKGGRSSTKSSFISICIVLLIRLNPEANVICLRKVGDTLRTSVFEQILWAIDILGWNSYFTRTVNPAEITYKPTGQKILFRGADDAGKLKSIKLRKGYFAVVWYEELSEFFGMQEIRNINQSLLRGGEKFWVFYSYNPPANTSNWVNIEAKEPRADRLVHHSTYLDVPEEWLKEVFIAEAEHLRKRDTLAYEHELLGKETGTGGTIFRNIKARTITDEEIRRFDNLREGIDFGYVNDPFVWGRLHYDKTRRRIYIFDEIYGLGISNRKAAELIKAKGYPITKITADSAEPKSIDEMSLYGLYITAAEKGPDSVEYGIQWLQWLDEIIIDPERCPQTYREFSSYELEKNKDGSFKDKAPDKNNHSIDMCRYSLEGDMKNSVSILDVL